MHRRSRIILGFIGMLFSFMVGAASVEGRFEPGQFFASVAGILFFIGVYRAIFSGKPEPEVAAVPNQDPILERRLADIQEIVISIDERLKRLESRPAPTPGPQPQGDTVT